MIINENNNNNNLKITPSKVNNNGKNKKINHQYNNNIKPLVRYNSTMSKLIILNFFNSIKESKVFSQNGEDGVLQSLISIFKLPKYNGTFV